MNVHFIGIGGIGVSALARYYLAKGHKVSGSDLVSSEITEALEKKGARIVIGKHKAENMPKDIDSVIYSPAIRPNNPELKKAYRFQVSSFRFQVKSYPEALGELTRQYFTIAVSGTHGKSTTASMLGFLLTRAGFDPTVIIGTKLKEFGNSNCRVGKSQYLVIEADEHFASFLNYRPKIIALTTLEPDHLDYYKNFKNYITAFKKFISLLPKNGILIANRDDVNVSKLSPATNFLPSQLFFEKFGEGEEQNLGGQESFTRHKFCKAKLGRARISKPQFKIQNYSLKQKEAKKLKKILKVPGEHNISNALAALTVARALKIPDRVSFKALAEYKGSWRRFEIKKARFQVSGFKFQVVSDYGHHPTEIAVTLKAAREKWPDKIIWLVFQPHQHRRTFYLLKDFVNIFRKSLISRWVDQVIITDIYDVAGREEKGIKKRVSAKILVDKIGKKGVAYLPKEKILSHLKQNLKGGEAVIIMGAGDIYKLVNITCQKGGRGNWVFPRVGKD